MPRRNDDDDFEDDSPRKAKPSRRDDDEFDDALRRRTAKPDTASRVMLIIAGTVLFIFMGCAGLGWYIFSSFKAGVAQVQKDMGQSMEKMREENERRSKEAEAERKREQEKQKEELAKSDFGQAKKVANEFLANVSGRRYDAIREMGTAKFQEKMTEEAIKSLIETNVSVLDQVKEFKEEFGGDKAKSGDLFTFSQDAFGRAGAGFQVVKVTMVKDGGKWKVDQFLIEKKQ